MPQTDQERLQSSATAGALAAIMDNRGFNELSRDGYVSHDGKGKRKRSSKKIIIGIALTVLLVVLAVVGAYIGIAQSYDGKFLPNTYVQSVDVAGMTWQEAEEAVSHQFRTSSTTIVEDGQEDVVLTGESLDLRPVTGEIEDLARTQDKWDWLSHQLGGPQELSVGIQYDDQMVMDAVSGLDCVNPENRIAPKDASIAYDESQGSFVAVPPVEGTIVDEGALLSAISQSISNGGGEVDVSSLYVVPALNVDSPEIVEAVDEANRVIGKKITYNIDMIDDAETLTREQLVSFVTLGDGGKLSVDEEAITAWLREMGEKYDTAGKPKAYATAYGKQVELAGGTYGWITDEAGMLPIVVDNILNADDIVDQDFVYQQEAAGPAGSGEWGDKYVDVDISEQKTRLIDNGQVINEFVCVTGNADGSHDTPVGVWSILEKAHDYKMTGADENGDGKPDYVSYTDTWCRFTWQGHGLHQLYRGTWAPTAYLNGNGSHGCVNLKNADADAVYAFVDYGTPVLVHL